MEQEIASQVVGLGGSTDFTLLSLFLRADFVVKSVIIILIAASVYSWALIFDKYRLFKKINNSILDFENKFWKAKSAESFDNNLPAKSNDPAVLIFRSAMNELKKLVQNLRLCKLRELRGFWKLIPITDKNNRKKFYISSYCRSHCSLYRIVWNCLGDYEFFSVYCNFKEHKSAIVALVSPKHCSQQL